MRGVTLGFGRAWRGRGSRWGQRPLLDLLMGIFQQLVVQGHHDHVQALRHQTLAQEDHPEQAGSAHEIPRMHYLDYILHDDVTWPQSCSTMALPMPLEAPVTRAHSAPYFFCARRGATCFLQNRS